MCTLTFTAYTENITHWKSVMQTQTVFDLMSSPWLRPSIQTPRHIARLVELQFAPYHAALSVLQECARGVDAFAARLSLLPGAQAAVSSSSKDRRNRSR